MVRRIRILALALLACALAACASHDDPTKDWTPERFYEEARTAMTDGDMNTAVKYYEQLESRYPYGRYTEQAQLEVIYAQYKNQEPALALAAADRFIRMHPTHPHVDYAYYLKGLINFRGERNFVLALFGSTDDMSDRDAKATRESYDAFRELTERFPSSRYAKDAAERMTYLIHNQARHEVQVAQYYFNNGAYVAAVNRCKYVLEHYPRTVSVETALGLQAKAYHHMGLAPLVDDTVKVLRANFPESPFLEEIRALRGG